MIASKEMFSCHVLSFDTCLEISLEYSVLECLVKKQALFNKVEKDLIKEFYYEY